MIHLCQLYVLKKEQTAMDTINTATFEHLIENKSANENAKEFWNKKADQFTKRVQNPAYRHDEFIFSNIDTLNLMDSSDSVVDIGCGPGRHAADFRKRGASYLGIDISDKMIEHARKIAQDHNLDLTFSAENWEENQNQFDIVFSSMCPAVHSEKTLKKFIALSKKYCILHRFLQETDNLSTLLEIPHINPAHNNPNYVYGIINMVWQLGYYPQMVIKDVTSTIELPLEEFKTTYAHVLNMASDTVKNSFDERIKPITKHGIVHFTQTQKKALIFWKVE